MSDVASGWIALPLVLPLGAFVLAFTLRGRWAIAAGLLSAAGAAAASLALAAWVWVHGAFRHPLGDWRAPLGIDLRVDGPAVTFLAIFSLVALAISVHAAGYFRTAVERDRFWPLWLLTQAALATLVLTGDLFNAYVAFELLGIAAVALVALAPGALAAAAAMRYLLVSLLGSLGYLAGVALVYAEQGVLDVATLAAAPAAVPPLALSLVFAGIALKTAVAPVHGWLPPAHGSAPAPASAALSALVIKGSFVLAFRLHLSLEVPVAAGTVLAAAGAAGVLWGSFLALRQPRLKLVVAYSTVAQIGYLFLAFGLEDERARAGVLFLALAHACAKAALFLAAGNLQRAWGHDRLAGLAGAASLRPMSVFAIGAAGTSIVGLPPTGGFLGKWFLLEAALAERAFGVVAVLLVGSFLAAVYVVRVLERLLAPGEARLEPVGRSMEVAPLLLALLAVGLGFLAPLPLELMAEVLP